MGVIRSKDDAPTTFTINRATSAASSASDHSLKRPANLFDKNMFLQSRTPGTPRKNVALAQKSRKTSVEWSLFAGRPAAALGSRAKSAQKAALARLRALGGARLARPGSPARRAGPAALAPAALSATSWREGCRHASSKNDLRDVTASS